MDDKSRKINQLSRLLFDKASNLFYGSILAELGLGVLVAVISPKLTQATHQYILSVVSLIMLLIIYWNKKAAETLHSDAETMRRQSVFSQALGWNLDIVSYQMWKDKADAKTLEKLEQTPLPKDYYATKQTDPAKKLLEMTNESAFWSMHFNRRAKSVFGLILLLFTGLTLVIFLALPYIQNAQFIAQALVLLIPTLLSIDALGLLFRLHMNEKELLDIYCETTKLLNKEGLTKDQPLAIRWASEYNCLMVNRVPMYKYFYNWWHDDIQSKWDHRND